MSWALSAMIMKGFVILRSGVVAVSCDAMFSLRGYADGERIGFDLLSHHWPHGQIAKAYGVFDDQAGCAVRGTFLLLMRRGKDQLAAGQRDRREP